MLIAIDIGNTNTGIVVIADSKMVTVESVKTGVRGCYEKRFSKVLRMLLKDNKTLGRQEARKGGTIKVDSDSRAARPEVIICSVVPKATVIAKRCVKKALKVNAQVVGKEIIVPIRNRYDNPEQVGQDRLVCAYAAVELYGVPCVVVDLGTAITFDVISSKREYLGGIIAPGIRLSAETLFQQTALLPKVLIHKPKQLIGKNTEESILSGMFYGYGEMIKGVVDLLGKELHQEPKIIVTGGFSDVMKKYIPDYPCIVDKELIFKGMSLIAAHSA